MREINEVWYFRTEEDMNEGNKWKSVGYTKTINGGAVIVLGKTTDYKIVKSNSENIIKGKKT